MARNLNYQLKTCIDKHFTPGVAKHSLKVTHEANTGRIYSYSDRNNMRDFAKQFSEFMKVNYPEVKMVRDITSKHCQSFLNSKQNSCSSATLKQYQSKFNKLEKVINNTYNAKVKFNTVAPKSFSSNGKVRNKSMTREDFNKVKATFKNPNSNGAKAMEISARWGLRVSEIAKLQGRDINLKENKIHVIDSKGGRSRDIDIRQGDKSFAIRLRNGCKDDYERIVPIRGASINVAVNRALEKAGLKEEYKDTSIHSIRKMAAQEHYDSCREQGQDINRALGNTSEFLGHSQERGKDMELMCAYVHNIH